MYELHEREQYFFDRPTLSRLADYLEGFERPCCICAPLLGKELAERGCPVRILDVDERFASVAGFRHYDLYRPEFLGEEFDLILCDPPFFRLSLAQLFAGLRQLARNDFTQPMLLSYLSRRAGSVEGTFAPFSLKRTGIELGYQTVKDVERNRIELFTNLSEERLEPLRELFSNPAGHGA